MVRRVFTKVLDGLGLTYGTFWEGGGEGGVEVFADAAGGLDREALVVSERLRL